MTEFPAISAKVCADLTGRMKQARKQKDEAAFALEKSKLLEVLAILKTADFFVYTKYSKYGEMAFYSEGNDFI